MASQSGTESSSVKDARDNGGSYVALERILRQTPQEVNFFQAVRLLARLMPDRSPVGRFAGPQREVVRFSAHASFPFPASQIQQIEWREGQAPVMVINFMGLTGPSGILPLYYTELLVERIRSKDRAMAEFFDMFNHRMTSLFYQAWEKYRCAISYETSYERGERDRFSHHLMDLIGIGSAHLERRLAVADDSLLFYAGILSLHTKPIAAFEGVLSDYFEVPVEVEPFTGSWHGLGDSDLCVFDRASTPSEQLGGGAIVGDEIYDQQSGARIKLGPLTLAQYLDFLPSGSAWEPLRSLTKFIANGAIDFEFQLILDKNEVPSCELGGDDEIAPRLGWTSWAKTRPLAGHATDTILHG